MMETLFGEKQEQRKTGRAAGGHYSGPGRPDNFQTPAHALRPLWPLLRPEWTIWEPACGKGNIVRAMVARGHCVVGTDIETGQDFMRSDFQDFDAIVTNPPFSIKDEWIERCYRAGKPFALLMPLTSLEGIRRQAAYRRYGMELIMMPSRVNFETPSGKGAGAWFPSAWFTFGLNVGRDLTFWTQETDAQADLFEEAA